MTATCPTCSQSIDPLQMLICRQSNVVSRFGQSVTLSPHHMIILTAIVDRHPRAVTRKHLAAKLWGAEDGPLDEMNTISVNLAQMRRKLRPLHISFSCRTAAGYRIVLDDMPAIREVA
jgi:DNA-binding response OmpR family regulator